MEVKEVAEVFNTALLKLFEKLWVLLSDEFVDAGERLVSKEAVRGKKYKGGLLVGDIEVGGDEVSEKAG